MASKAPPQGFGLLHLPQDAVLALAGELRDAALLNLQVLPDTLLAGVLLFAMLLQSTPLTALGLSLLLLGLVHGRLAAALAAAIPGLYDVAGGACSGRFPAVSLDRAFTLGAAGVAAVEPGWPSYYATFMGFLGGYVASLPATYAPELRQDVRRAGGVYAGLAVLGALLLLVAAFRLASGCDSGASTLAGLVGGGLLGAALHAFLAWWSDRRWTNLLATPLLRARGSVGAPLYVCDG